MTATSDAPFARSAAAIASPETEPLNFPALSLVAVLLLVVVVVVVVVVVPAATAAGNAARSVATTVAR